MNKPNNVLQGIKKKNGKNEKKNFTYNKNFGKALGRDLTHFQKPISHGLK